MYESYDSVEQYQSCYCISDSSVNSLGKYIVFIYLGIVLLVLYYISELRIMSEKC